ncbi:MAG: ABC transporter ATP-binding protein, partial [Pseudomonadota bacterium]
MAGQTKTIQREGTATPPPLAIELRDVSKSFGTVQANRNINLKVEAGSIHGIVGENGAGKSTLMNILYGLHTADSGEILINGEPVSIRSSADAIACGIGMVHQHFMLVPNFSVLENVMLGSEGGMSLKKGRTDTLQSLTDLANEYGMKVDPDALIEDLPVGTRQRVEIIKAMRGGARILILDEPTGVLTPQEADSLFEILRVLKSRGVTVLLITHKLGEIMAITDNVSIIRDGTVVGHRRTRETSTGELAELMVGREVLLTVDRGTPKPAETRLSVRNLGCTGQGGVPLLHDVSLEIRSGEILGIAGVAGNGQTELLEALSGMRKPDTGSIDVLGNRIDPTLSRTPAQMRELGVGHIPEDRHHHGLVLNFEASENMVFGFHRNALSGDGILLNADRMTAHCRTQMDQYDIRPRNPGLDARNFSGGNQQKIVIAREMHAEPGVLIVGQPTRGVDIGAIEFIHKQLIALRDRGCAILLVSVELDEILGLSD